MYNKGVCSFIILLQLWRPTSSVVCSPRNGLVHCVFTQTIDTGSLVKLVYLLKGNCYHCKLQQRAFLNTVPTLFPLKSQNTISNRNTIPSCPQVTNQLTRQNVPLQYDWIPTGIHHFISFPIELGPSYMVSIDSPLSTTSKVARLLPQGLNLQQFVLEFQTRCSILLDFIAPWSGLNRGRQVAGTAKILGFCNSVLG